MSKLTGPNMAIVPRVFVAPDAKSAPMVGATGTNPRSIWASCSDYHVLDAGSSTTDQFFCTRVKARIQGGKWLALAPVFVASYINTSHSPIGTPNTAPYTVSWALELSNGTTPTAYDYLNTGGVIVAGKFNAGADGIVRPGDIVIGDFLYASDFALSYFEFTDRSKLPWIRCAYSKTGASDLIGAVAITDYNAPMNQWYATVGSYAAGKTLIGAANASVNAGGWGTGDNDVPSCIGFIGIPMDGQKAILFMGTSILDGDGNMASYKNGGVNPANNSMQNYDLLGWPCAYAQNLSNQVPVLNFAVGGSAMASVWSDTASDYAWSTDGSISLQRFTLATLARYFDLAILHDVHNDGGISATYASVLKALTNDLRSANPLLKIGGCRVPNGYVDIAGATQAYNTALDTRWTAQDGMVTAGYWDFMTTVRNAGVNIYPDLGTQVSSVTTSLGTLTTLNDSGAAWIPGQWVNSWVSVGGVQKLISANTRTQLTFGAMAGAVVSGTSYLILGNTTGDGIHPNSVCQKLMLAVNFKANIAQYLSIPYFTRTA